MKIIEAISFNEKKDVFFRNNRLSRGQVSMIESVADTLDNIQSLHCRHLIKSYEIYRYADRSKKSVLIRNDRNLSIPNRLVILTTTKVEDTLPVVKQLPTSSIHINKNIERLLTYVFNKLTRKSNDTIVITDVYKIFNEVINYREF